MHLLDDGVAVVRWHETHDLRRGDAVGRVLRVVHKGEELRVAAHPQRSVGSKRQVVTLKATRDGKGRMRDCVGCLCGLGAGEHKNSPKTTHKIPQQQPTTTHNNRQQQPTTTARNNPQQRHNDTETTTPTTTTNHGLQVEKLGVVSVDEVATAVGGNVVDAHAALEQRHHKQRPLVRGQRHAVGHLDSVRNLQSARE